MRLAAAAVAALLLATPAVAVAQSDDWGVTRDPFDKAVVAKLKGILSRNPSDADALAKLLTMYRRYRTVAQLRDEYEAVLAKKPNDWASLVVLGRIARGQGDDTTALGLFERAAAVKDDAAVAVELGALYRITGKTTEARAAFDKALAAAGASKPIKMKALRALADLALAAKDIDGARRYFDQYIALDPGNASLRLELGDALSQAGRHDDAIAVYEDAEKRLGSDPARKVEVVARIGQALEQKGDDALAVAAYRRAIKLVPRGYYLEVELTARIVDIYRRKQTLPELLAYYEKDWPEGRRGHFEWDTLARLYEETGDQEKAVVAYKKAVAKAPYELETQRRLIQLLEAVGREKEALAQYEVVVREAPGEARFQIELAERLWRSGEEKRALDVLKRMEGRFPGDAGAQSAIADMYLRWGKDDLAMAALERLARLEPDDPAHLVTLGEQYHQRGQKDKAMATWKRIANTRSATGYAKLGDVLAEHDAPAEGLVYYAKAIKLEPNNAELYKGRAQIHERQKQFAEAIADWEKALLLWTKPSDRSARREARRRIVAVLQRWDGGRKAAEYVNRWKAAFNRTPPDLEAGYFLVAHYEHPTRAVKGEPRTTLERLHQLDPSDQDTIQDLVKAYVAAQMWDEAVDKLKTLAKLAPAREREVYGQIAEIMTKARRDTEAIEWAQKALAKSPNDPVAYERLAERYFEMNQFDQSAAAYEKAIQLDPRNFKAHFALADIYGDLLDQPDKAIDLYRRILRQSTDDDQLLRAGKRAIVLAETKGSLGELEKVVAPLSTILGHKPVYRRILVELFDHYVGPLEQRTRRGPPEVRAAARAELERLGRGGMKALLDALADESDPVQRGIAVDVLGHLNNKAAAMPLVRMAREEPPPVDPGAPRAVGSLTQAPDLESRVAALVAAGRLGDPRVVSETLPMVKHADISLREAAVFTLGRTGDVRALPALLGALADGRPSVQALACLGLGRLADARARAAVEKRVTDVRTPDLVRASCAIGLADDASAALAPLTTALADNAGETQRIAAWALGQLGDKKALPALWAAYFRRVGQDRSTIAWAIARLGAGTAVPGAVLDASIYPMRAGKLDLAAMVRELPGELPDSDIPPSAIVGHETEIAQAIEVGLAAHRDEALSVLTDLDARDDGLGLGTIVGAAPPPAVAAALDAIGKRILPTVITRTSDDDLKVAARALSVAAKIGGPTAAAAVEKALHSPSRLVRTTATRSIALLHRRGAMTPTLRTALVAQLGSSDWEDRQNAAIALGGLGADADVDALVKALKDPWSFVRDAAAQSLGKLRAHAAVPALREATQDINPAVRASAERALAEIAGP